MPQSAKQIAALEKKASAAIAALQEATGDKEAALFLRKVIANVTRGMKRQPKVPYSQDIADEICERMQSGETLENVCKDDHMPSMFTIYKWLDSQPGFSQAYARARIQQMQAWADQIITLADELHEDEYRIQVPLGSKWLAKIEKDEEVEFTYRKRHLDRAKLMIDTRKWLMSKVDPESFGDKLTHAVVHEFADKEDSEIMKELSAEMERAGISKADLTAMLGSQGVSLPN